ncbi:hypothetical protein PNBC_04180 [Paenibacillus crassostreae]|uniref:DUF2264 domain-containing protein n=2 Tax=Paenibacillus crassostreae TaxID=1763538 RepID=A0A167FIZ9_9BACL|nr:hypothetical protein PNBC_04180 [Paenibacillus crassostreae]
MEDEGNMMGTKSNSISDNPLRTKADLQDALRQIVDPLQPYYSEGRARLSLGVTGAGYDPKIAEFEGFSRVLWGMVPLLAGGGDNELWKICLLGIRNGTDPEHAEYWGNVNDYDQRLVEMAVFGFALALIPDRIWEPLSERERSNLYNWLNQINSHPCHDCNWLFFHVLVNMGFRTMGLPYDDEQLNRNLTRIDEFYLAEGWYSDGIGAHSDYYVPFGFHYYGLLYSQLMKDEDPERAVRFKQRATEFAESFIQWFAADGSTIPYGRSLTYRFSHSAFWSAMVFAEVDTIPLGVMKGLILRNLRWWFQKPIFNEAGVLTVGYTYPNLVMAENYNSPGSPYWALKSFLPLALADDHPFWHTEELPLPKLNSLSVQLPPHLVICRNEVSDHITAFNSGHLSSNEHIHTSAKYEKFAYSNAFGFSVPRAEWGLGQGAFDSMLALSEGDNLFRVRRKNEESRIEDNVLYSKWKPWHDVEIQTWIVAGLPWHIRIHQVNTQRTLDAAEGGFALGSDLDLQVVNDENTGITASCSQGSSRIVSILGYDTTDLIYANANTNVLHTLTVIPSLKVSLEPGTHWIISAIYGEPGERVGESSLLEDPCEILNVQFEGDEIHLTTARGKVIVIVK